LRLASEWLASFHAEQEVEAVNRFGSYLARYDTDYYLGWSKRVAEFGRSLYDQYPWLPKLCTRANDSFQHLVDAPVTVIHGECYATNWLVNESSVVSIDWESGALAAGAIDVASVAWGWGDEALRECKLAYVYARWPSGAPATFESQMTAARLYLALRWLGDCPEWTTASDPPVSFEELFQIGEEAGLV
jgi:thiamine kinase-like enzyme